MQGVSTRREEFEAAVLQSWGSTRFICRELGISQATVYDLFNRYPDLKEVFQAQKRDNVRIKRK